MMIAAPTRMSTPSSAAVRFSTFSWPYGWLGSGGSSALRTEKYATTDASRSIAECTASVRIAIEPVTAPATIFSTISVALDAIDSPAARVFVGRSVGLAAVRKTLLMPPGFPDRATQGTPEQRGRGG